MATSSTFNSSKKERAANAFNEVNMNNFKLNRTKSTIATGVGVTLSILKMRSDPHYSKASVLTAAGVGCWQVIAHATTYTLEDSKKETNSTLGFRIFGSLFFNRVVGAVANKIAGPGPGE